MILKGNPIYTTYGPLIVYFAHALLDDEDTPIRLIDGEVQETIDVY